MDYTINEEMARLAHQMNSYSDYKPGSATAAYKRLVAEAQKIAKRQKQLVDPIFHDKIDALFDKYCKRLAENLNAYYRIETYCPSILVTGGSNFPTRKKEKQNAARKRNRMEYDKVQNILSKMKRVGLGGIASNDPNAIEKLEKKLVDLQRKQERMKRINAYYRKHKTCVGYDEFTEEEARNIDAKIKADYSWNQQPFPSYLLTNNNAKIRQTKERIESLKKIKGASAEEWKMEGVQYIENTDMMRMQFLFDEKPDAPIRTILRDYGFQWAPSQSAWQRQLTPNGRYAAKRVMEKLEDVFSEKGSDCDDTHKDSELADPISKAAS